MDRARFYASLRQRASGIFGTSLSQQQVTGIEGILDEGQRRRVPLNQLAYMLATAYHETGHKMVPNVENLNYTTAARIRAVWPSRFPTAASAQPYVRNPRGLANKVYNGRMGNRAGSDDGWNFRGRGYPHVTGRDNYGKATTVTGVDLIANPDLAVQPNVAIPIFFSGMLQGWFTGKKLSDYLTETKSDYVNARRIVNGTDRASDIAGYAKAFEAALTAAGFVARAPIPTPAPEKPHDVVAPLPDPRPDPQPSAPSGGGFWAALAAFLSRMFKRT